MSKVIGLVGNICSGKSLVASLLKDQGYTVFSLSDAVREEAKKLGIDLSRKNLQDLGNKRREEKGGGYWAKKIHENILIYQSMGVQTFVIEGLRNPAEIAELKKVGIVLIAITAPIEQRIEWILKRAKDSDPKTREEIIAMDERDRGLKEAATGQQVEATVSMAKIKIVNNGTLEEFIAKIERAVNLI